jgi:hypothetical protein
VSAAVFVIRRKELSGRPTYLTQRGGWTTSTGKAQTFATAAEAEEKLHGRVGEIIPMPSGIQDLVKGGGK